MSDVKLVPMHNPKQLELLRAAYTPEHWEKICEGLDSEDSLDEARYTNRVTHTYIVVHSYAINLHVAGLPWYRNAIVK